MTYLMDLEFEQYYVEEHSISNSNCQLLIDYKEIIYHGTIGIVTKIWKAPYGQGRMGSRIKFQTAENIDFFKDLFERKTQSTLIVFPSYSNRMIFKKTIVMQYTIKTSYCFKNLSIVMSGKLTD